MEKHHDLATLARYHDRLAQLAARRDTLEQQSEAIREQITDIDQEQKGLLNDVLAGVPEPSGNRWEPIAKTGDYPDGLFRIKRQTRRSANDKKFTELVDRYPRLLGIANAISVSIPGGTALLSIEGDPSSRTALGDFVADKIARAKKKASKKGLEKALETGALPKYGELPPQIIADLADIFEVTESVVVEAVATTPALAAEETPQRKDRS
jgi:hypothetical protein